ncbi:hypothetical protein P5V15_008314 [Pogonomyrmex californicus]
MGALLSGDRQSEIDHVYGLYFDKGSMFGDKRFDVVADDSVMSWAMSTGTPGLYIDLQETPRRRRVHGERQANVQEYTVDYERPSAWSQHAYARSREQKFQVHHRTAFVR